VIAGRHHHAWHEDIFEMIEATKYKIYELCMAFRHFSQTTCHRDNRNYFQETIHVPQYLDYLVT
jgi:hypothetical protein